MRRAEQVVERARLHAGQCAERLAADAGHLPEFVYRMELPANIAEVDDALRQRAADAGDGHEVLYTATVEVHEKFLLVHRGLFRCRRGDFGHDFGFGDDHRLRFWYDGNNFLNDRLGFACRHGFNNGLGFWNITIGTKPFLVQQNWAPLQNQRCLKSYPPSA